MTYIKSNGLDITFSENDIQKLNSILYDATEGIKKSIDNHYICLQDVYNRGFSYAKETFLEQKSGEMQIIDELYDRISGHRDIRGQLLKYLEEQYNKRHKKNKLK